MRVVWIWIVYLWGVCLHKIYVIFMGIRQNWILRSYFVRVPLLRLIFHDWVKFLPCEFFPYAFRHISGKYDRNNLKHRESWRAAWKHHATSQDHHWEYWLELECNFEDRYVLIEKQNCVRNMKIEAALEVPIDWFAAHLAYEHTWTLPNKKNWSYLEPKKFCESRQYHPVTRLLLIIVWYRLGYKEVMYELFGTSDDEMVLKLAEEKMKNSLEEWIEEKKLKMNDFDSYWNSVKYLFSEVTFLGNVQGTVSFFIRFGIDFVLWIFMPIMLLFWGYKLVLG